MKTPKKVMRLQRRGLALPLVVVVLVVLLAIGSGLLDLGLHHQVFTIRSVSAIQAQCAADAALTKALFEMNGMWKGKALDDSNIPHATLEALPNCDATLSYSVSGDRDSGFTIKAVGKSGRAVKVIYANLGLKSLFDNAILVQDRISLMPNTLLTGYNSADAADTDIDVKIGTTGTLSDRIPLGPGTVVDGDVFVGVGGDPSVVVGAGGTITGEKYALTEEPEFPVITPPPLPDMGTDLSADSTTLTIGPGDSGKYTAITLSGGGGGKGVLEISGGDVALHITGNIDVGNGCEVIVREGSSLTIYVDGDVDADNSMGFNNEAGNVEEFGLYATGEGEQEFALKAKSNVFGVVYAPNANITLYPSSEIHGAIVGNSVTIKSGGTFYYDEALKGLHDVGVRFVVKRWYEE